MRRQFFLAVVLTVGSPALAAEQFDLGCEGVAASAVSDKYRPAISARYRVDLTANEWCVGDCSSVLKIASVTSGTLTLSANEPTFARGGGNSTEINRMTGEWRQTIYRLRRSGGGFTINVTGKCELLPFSGFSLGKPKF